MKSMTPPKILIVAALPLLLFSCVSKKKFSKLENDYFDCQANQKICQSNGQLSDQKIIKLSESNNSLSVQNKDLQVQVDYLKKNSNQVLSALTDMSVMSTKQAESVKQSLESLSAKDSYIKALQSAISSKDSMNMALVMNLKSKLADVNDQDINIKVEKGVVYIDISDKLLFNSGKYNVTDKAKVVLGKVATVLNTYPDIEFMVEGHTDNVPIKTACLEDNWDLSVKRATSIVRILEKDYGIKPLRMTAAGHSEYVPVAANDTPENRALNRRTRIIILPQLDQFFKLLLKK
jgi:chemotaxis protein MotB